MSKAPGSAPWEGRTTTPTSHLNLFPAIVYSLLLSGARTGWAAPCPCRDFDLTVAIPSPQFEAPADRQRPDSTISGQSGPNNWFDSSEAFTPHLAVFELVSGGSGANSLKYPRSHKRLTAKEPDVSTRYRGLDATVAVAFWHAELDTEPGPDSPMFSLDVGRAPSPPRDHKGGAARGPHGETTTILTILADLVAGGKLVDAAFDTLTVDQVALHVIRTRISDGNHHLRHELQAAAIEVPADRIFVIQNRSTPLPESITGDRSSWCEVRASSRHNLETLTSAGPGLLTTEAAHVP